MLKGSDIWIRFLHQEVDRAGESWSCLENVGRLNHHQDNTHHNLLVDGLKYVSCNGRVTLGGFS